ncbi:hypothetical protein FN924_05370 [Radiobacillus deserti]|uniref:Uncharacterized protein n=1 Tax=Radiobacillus deserti TaxID=2594883 RepID=A0A516KL36_9BACI|nr:hypothetical protein FN924_05370 [Radiobacillus deserti]
MLTRKHLIFNIFLLIVPWCTVLFIGKRTFSRYSSAGFFIVIFEIINHLFGHKRNWWKFYDKRRSFIRDELPFDIGPYMPISLWILKFSYGNFKKYVLLNVLANGLFAFYLINVLKKMKIIGLDKLNHLQFFLYFHYKAYILYFVQYLFEKINKERIA